jgi:hypothetical protein
MNFQLMASNKRQLHVLLGIICRVGEDPGVESTCDAVAAEDDDSVLVRLQELVVQQDIPLLVEEFSVTMCRTLAGHASTACKILE